MNVQQKKALQIFRRLREFLQRTTPDVELVTLDRQVEALTAVIDRLTQHTVEQDARTRLSRSGTTTNVRLVRRLRRQFMRPVSRMARTLFPDDASLLRALQMPRARDIEGTVAAALGMADAAEAQQAHFVALGFAEDFLERLRKEARAMKVALDAQASDAGRRAAATVGVQEEVARGRLIVRLVDSTLSPVLEAQPALLAEWNALKRLARSTAQAGGGGTPEAAGTTAAPVVAVAGEGVEVRAVA